MEVLRMHGAVCYDNKMKHASYNAIEPFVSCLLSLSISSYSPHSPPLTLNLLLFSSPSFSYSHCPPLLLTLLLLLSLSSSSHHPPSLTLTVHLFSSPSIPYSHSLLLLPLLTFFLTLLLSISMSATVSYLVSTQGMPPCQRAWQGPV